jgi:hypothetical protein
MKAIAEREHEEAREGVFHDRSIHERDRRAKYGGRPPARLGKVEKMPQKGLIPPKQYKLVRVSSESRANGKLAKNAFDGDPGTWWHTNFEGNVDKHPHELVVDLGADHTIRGFRYLARQDQGWNGAIKDCEFYVSSVANAFDTVAAKATFTKTKKAQDVTCKPVKGRYVLVRVLSEVNGGPWASISELGIIGE